MSRAQLPAAGSTAATCDISKPYTSFNRLCGDMLSALRDVVAQEWLEGLCRCMNKRNYATPSQHKHAGLRMPSGLPMGGHRGGYRRLLMLEV